MLLAAALALSSPPAEPRCTLSIAVPASVREMGRHPEQWLGRCVRVEGYVSWNKFYVDVAGAYAEAASNRNDRANDGWLGLYYRGSRRLNRDLRRGTVYGVLHDCGRDYDAAAATAGPDTLVMPVGYCHYQGGLVLLSAGFRVAGSARFERQMGEAARSRFGDLAPPSPDNPVPGEVVRLADRFLTLVKASDGPGLQSLVHLWSEADPETEAARRAFTDWLRGEGDSPLRVLRSGAAPQRAYFQQAVWREAAADGGTGDWHICFCRTADCAGRWPISAFDATSAPALPYICVRAYRHDHGRGEPDRLGIDRASQGFAEPGPPIPDNASTR